MSFLCKCFKKDKKPKIHNNNITMDSKVNQAKEENKENKVEDSIFSNDSNDEKNKRTVGKRKSSKKIISNFSELGNLKVKENTNSIPQSTTRKINENANIEVLDNYICEKKNKISTVNRNVNSNHFSDDSVSQGDEDHFSNKNRLESKPNEIIFQSAEKKLAQIKAEINNKTSTNIIVKSAASADAVDTKKDITFKSISRKDINAIDKEDAKIKKENQDVEINIEYNLSDDEDQSNKIDSESSNYKETIYTNKLYNNLEPDSKDDMNKLENERKKVQQEIQRIKENL